MLMTYERLFFSFSGRIGRGHFWLGSLVLMLVEINYLILMAFVLELKAIDFWNETRTAQLVMLSAFLLVLVPGLAVGIKRLHDRDIPGWWYGLFHLLIFQVHIQPFYGRILQPGSLEWLVLNLPLFVAGILAIWLLIELGVLRGKRGRNRYGDDPKVGLEMRVNA